MILACASRSGNVITSRLDASNGAIRLRLGKGLWRHFLQGWLEGGTLYLIKGKGLNLKYRAY